MFMGGSVGRKYKLLGIIFKMFVSFDIDDIFEIYICLIVLYF